MSDGRPTAGRVIAVVAAVLLVGALPHAGQSSSSTQALPTVTPTAGLVIDRSVRLAPGTYRLPVGDDGAALVVRGDGLTVDMTGVTLEGGDPQADPDGYVGIGVRIEDSADVTVRGAAIRGYKVGILARRTPRLHLTGNNLSYNWKPRLWSGIEKESLLDWMSYHDNEDDEWVRYGAGIYLSQADDAEIDRNRVVQGQNGLMVTRSSSLNIWNNDFSFNSGIGIGLYRTTSSRVMHNKLDWNVRGYSHGFYFRGQDSAAILMYEQTSDNVVAFNSATHGGDGVFLWAGQTTMDTGEGGANDNRFWHNDFSHAVANGIEATFSRNSFHFNRIEDCWHGVWGGYSYDTTFSGNTFARNDEAIAIEHGQNITIFGNTFTGDGTAIRLWANATQDPNWGYPKARDTRSRDYLILDNRFTDVEVAIDLTRTIGVDGGDNRFSDVETRVRSGDEVVGVDLDSTDRMIDPAPLSAVPGGQDAMLPDGARRGRETIIVDEWGPYDYRSPKLWPVVETTLRDRPLRMRVLGPAGTWQVREVTGATLDRQSGAVPGEVVVTPTGTHADVRLSLGYIGGAVVTPRGVAYAAGETVPFSWTHWEPAIDWEVRWWSFGEAEDPLTAPAAFARRTAQTPTRVETLRGFDLVGSGPLSAGLPPDGVAMRATATVELPAGTHILDVLSDDGVRLWVDDVLVLERWDIHGTERDRVVLPGGRHDLRIEYFERSGWSELKLIWSHDREP